ncbi:MAG: alanine racemase [Mogibacterium sp.]|nr:alanine racemase [Mogibacterium sp.]
MTIDFKAISEQTGSPSYIFSEKLFRERAEKVKAAFGPDVDICYSIKAGSFLLSILPEVFAKIEVCSPGELEICKALHMDPAKIIFSGVNKSREDIDEAIRYGSAVLTAESRNHVRDINASALTHGIVAEVLLRLTGGSQFGMDAEEVLAIIRERDQYPGIHIRGIHYFTGTQKRKAKPILKELATLEAFLGRIEEETGYAVTDAEYGTGLAVDYFAGSMDEAEALEMERLASVSDAIRALGQKVHVTIEMGRFFAAPCGFYVTQVVDTKTCEGIRYAIVDGGLHQLKYDGQLQGMQVPVIYHLKADGSPAPACTDGEPEQWTLCGSLCTTADVLARNAVLPGLTEGDYLVFTRTGAYSVMEGMAVFLSRDMPKVYILREDGTLALQRSRIDTWTMNLPESMRPE